MHAYPVRKFRAKKEAELLLVGKEGTALTCCHENETTNPEIMGTFDNIFACLFRVN